GGPGLGSADERAQVQARQPGRHPGLQQGPDRRIRKGRDGHRAASRKARVLQLARRHHRRPRHRSLPPRHKRGAGHQGQAHLRHREHRQGQGRLLHGGRGGLAWRRPECRAGRARHRGAEEVMSVKKATRQAFGEALVRLGEERQDIVVLDADLAKSTKSELFGKKFPERFFEMGIQEANMLGTAAGLALCGKVPFACSFACFITGRYDQIRISVAYSEANVRIVGTHAGIAVGDDGYSQQGLEDIALMRALPTMAVIQPADDVETEAVVRYLADHEGPAYLRLTRQNVDRIHSEDYVFRFGRIETLRDGKDAVIFATGAQVAESLRAAEALAAEGI